ncbi:MAG TPA: hypothetical protein VGJ45_11265 [Pseudonocardiaceae bacterium]|jgi:hypothetical protein
MTSTRYGDAIEDALDRLDDLGYERGGDADLANHGPMAAEALAVLGHGDQVPDWVRGYRAAMDHHEPPSARFAIGESSWRDALGAFDRVGDWEALFQRELAEQPWREVLARWWPRLLPGLFSRLTHGVIRTAHAVRSVASTDQPSQRQLTELARGLAYWAARYTGLPGQARFVGQRALTEAVAALPRPSSDLPPGARFARVGSLPGYAAALESIGADQLPDLLGDMTTTFAGIALAHPEINPVPLVHGVTAPAAVRLVLPHLPAELVEPSLAALWQVHTALLLMFTGDAAAEADVLARAMDTDVPAFDELIERAVEHGDEHVIKFTEACLREHVLRPDPRFPAAVFAAQQRIPRWADRQ